MLFYPAPSVMQVTWEELQKLCAEVVLFNSSPGHLFIVRGAEECANLLTRSWVCVMGRTSDL